MLCFINPGEIDPLTITTMGVNVKPGNASPIGFFGTGLKYAIAAGLRQGLEITIYSGLRKFTFQAKPQIIRDKEFGIVWMTEHLASDTISAPLGFTTDLGRQWELWQVYREFWANAKDEHGAVLSEPPAATAGQTRIVVSGMDKVHANRREFLLDESRVPLAENADVQLFAGVSNTIFYQGIRVFRSPDKATLFTYNFLRHLPLTEDRTMNGTWEASKMLATFIVRDLTDQHAIEEIIIAEAGWEKGLDLDWNIEPSETFLAAAAAMNRKWPLRLNSTARTVLYKKLPQLAEPTAATLSQIETMTIARALEFLSKIGYEIDYPVQYVENLGTGIHGRVINGKVYISRLALSRGTKWLAGTLLEEHLHKTTGMLDCSLELQQWLFDAFISAKEELLGEPL
jgi:hypothetical protein